VSRLDLLAAHLSAAQLTTITREIRLPARSTPPAISRGRVRGRIVVDVNR